VISTLVVVALAVVALAYVALPSRRPDRAGPLEASSTQEVSQQRKRAALVGIIDLEDEHAVGKLSNEDFESLKAEYEGEAVAALRELDAFAGSTWDDDELEIEIARIREQLKCPTCGAPRAPGGACATCGA
jgi:hypothetical protein